MKVILSTCPPAEAARLARLLVSAGAACVNIVPGLTSVYVWEGSVQEDGETLLVVKAAREKVPALFDALKAVHPYTLPEWVVLDVDEALTSSDYRAWVRSPH
jgi:periplasmic divalent cation tolerance protein